MRTQSLLIAAAITSTLMLGAAHAEQKPVPTNPGQPSGAPPSTPTWTVPATQPNNITIKQKSNYAKPEDNPNARQKPDEHGCLPPTRWDPTQSKCVVGIKVKPHDNPAGDRTARPIEERGPKAVQPRPVGPVPPQNCGPTQPGNPASSTC